MGGGTYILSPPPFRGRVRVGEFLQPSP